jgi:hypothetical protein
MTCDRAMDAVGTEGKYYGAKTVRVAKRRQGSRCCAENMCRPGPASAKFRCRGVACASQRSITRPRLSRAFGRHPESVTRKSMPVTPGTRESCGRPKGRVARRQAGAARLPTHAAPRRDAHSDSDPLRIPSLARPRRLSLGPGGRASMARVGHASSAPRRGRLSLTGAGPAIRVRHCSHRHAPSRPSRTRTRWPGFTELRL